MADESSNPVVIWQRERMDRASSFGKPTLYRIVRLHADVQTLVVYEKSTGAMIDALGVRSWMRVEIDNGPDTAVLLEALVEQLDEKERQCRR